MCFREVTFTAPSLSPGVTMTDFIAIHLQNNMKAISQQNDPVVLMQYAVAVLNLLNAQSESALDTSELSNRTGIRDLVATVISGLPTTTTFHIQLMASVTELLTVGAMQRLC